MSDEEKRPEDKDFVTSYLNLRKAVGWLGILLPIVLAVGFAVFGAAFGRDDPFPDSISAYYYTIMDTVR